MVSKKEESCREDGCVVAVGDKQRMAPAVVVTATSPALHEREEKERSRSKVSNEKRRTTNDDTYVRCICTAAV